MEMRRVSPANQRSMSCNSRRRPKKPASWGGRRLCFGSVRSGGASTSSCAVFVIRASGNMVANAAAADWASFAPPIRPARDARRDFPSSSGNRWIARSRASGGRIPRTASASAPGMPAILLAYCFTGARPSSRRTASNSSAWAAARRAPTRSMMPAGLSGGGVPRSIALSEVFMEVFMLTRALRVFFA